MAAKKSSKPLKVNMESVWKRFYIGDHITDDELDCAINENEIMLEMLHSKGPSLGVVTKVLAQELASLRSYKWSRETFK